MDHVCEHEHPRGRSCHDHRPLPPRTESHRRRAWAGQVKGAVFRKWKKNFFETWDGQVKGGGKRGFQKWKKNFFKNSSQFFRIFFLKLVLGGRHLAPSVYF